MISFEYHAPRSMEEILSLLENRGKEVKVLAGGTDLLVQMKDGYVHPSVIVNAKNIQELNRLEWDEKKPFILGPLCH